MAALPAEKPYTTVDYWNVPEGLRSELIEGEFYDMTPPTRTHQQLVAQITHQLLAFVEEHGGPCKVFPAPFAVNLFDDDFTWVEPDVVVVCDPEKLAESGCIGAPDMAVEVVSPSSRRMDYITKADLYERAGVREYWIVDPTTGKATVYRFETGDPTPRTFAFDEPVAVGIWDDGPELVLARML